MRPYHVMSYWLSTSCKTMVFVSGWAYMIILPTCMWDGLFCHIVLQTQLLLLLDSSQSPCTALKAGICLSLGLCKGTISGIWKMVEIPIGYVSPQCNGTWCNPSLYLDQPITNGWCQVANLITSPVATRLGLCSCLYCSRHDVMGETRYMIQGAPDIWLSLVARVLAIYAP